MAVGQFSVSARRSIDSLLENTPVRTKSQTEDDIVAEGVEMRSTIRRGPCSAYKVRAELTEICIQRV